MTGGLIHTAMFARLLMSEFVIADMTTANPNVFYELGVRHTARPYTTVPIFATLGAPPFDVNMVRAIPYALSSAPVAGDGPRPGELGARVLELAARIDSEAQRPGPDPVLLDGHAAELQRALLQLREAAAKQAEAAAKPGKGLMRLSPAAAQALREALTHRLRTAMTSPVAKDSPLFQLFDDFPGITMSHELTDVFRDRVAYSEQLKARLVAARALEPRERALQALHAIEAELGEIATVERGVVVDLLLSYRAEEDFEAMISLYERMAGEVREAAITRQQLAFALNRRNQPGDSDRAVQVLEALLKSHGDNAETLGLLGRLYKDRYKAAAKAQPGSPAARGWLDEAINIYTRGFEAEPLDFYPGINALTLLTQKGGAQAEAEIRRLAPLVTFAALRRGGEKSSDYWTVATVLELACHTRDAALAERSLTRAIMLAQRADELWMLKTTRENLVLIARQASADASAAFVDECIAELDRVVPPQAG